MEHSAAINKCSIHASQVTINAEKLHLLQQQNAESIDACCNANVAFFVTILLRICCFYCSKMLQLLQQKAAFIATYFCIPEYENPPELD